MGGAEPAIRVLVFFGFIGTHTSALRFAGALAVSLSLSLSLCDLLHRSNWFVQNSSCRCRRPCPIRSLALSHSFLYYFATHPMRGISIIGPASFDSACDVAYGAASRATGTDPPPPCMCVRVCMSAAMLARTPCCDVSSNQRAEPHAHTHTYAMPYRFLPPLLIYKLYLGISRMGGALYRTGWAHTMATARIEQHHPPLGNGDCRSRAMTTLCTHQRSPEKAEDGKRDIRSDHGICGRAAWRTTGRQPARIYAQRVFMLLLLCGWWGGWQTKNSFFALILKVTTKEHHQAGIKCFAPVFASARCAIVQRSCRWWCYFETNRHPSINANNRFPSHPTTPPNDVVASAQSFGSNTGPSILATQWNPS